MMANMAPFFAEGRCLLPSGVVQWSMLASSPRRAPDRRILCTTFEHGGIGMAVMDLQGRPLQCNPALQRMLGYTKEELLRKSFADFTYPEDRAMNLQLYHDLVEGKRDSYQIEKPYIRKDRQVIWGNLTGSLVRDSEGTARYVSAWWRTSRGG